MDSEFKIEGKLINLRATIKADLKNYEKWNSPDLKAYQFDGPWYKTDKAPLKCVINWRKIWLEGETKVPYPFLEIETKENFHIGWVTAYYHKDDPHITEIGINIPEDSCWGKGMIKVGEKLGFVEESRIRKSCEIDGVFYDRIKMGILRSEWKNKKECSA